MNHIHKVAAIVNDDVRTGRDDLADSVHIFFCAGSVDCENIQSFVHKSRCYVILSRERIAARDVHLGSTCRKDFTEMRSLGFKMYGQSYFLACERLILAELRLEPIEQGHMPPDPFNLQLPVFP